MNRRGVSPAVPARATGRAIQHYGDVTVLTVGRMRLAVACDSLGAIGPKPGDRVRVPGYVVGRFAARVPLMELVALGAEPLLVVCALCVEPEPAGAEIMRGVCDEMRSAGLDPALALTGSTEKNVPTSQTGVGVTAVGALRRPRWGRARPGDPVFAVGRPKAGPEVRLDDPDLADIPTLRRALSHPACGDAVPVGSRGIGAEARDLASRGGWGFAAASRPGVDLSASAGPSTCFLAAVREPAGGEFLRHMAAAGRPCSAVGVIREAEGRRASPPQGGPGTGPQASPGGGEPGQIRSVRDRT